jgi:hypothetical protein
MLRPSACLILLASAVAFVAGVPAASAAPVADASVLGCRSEPGEKQDLQVWIYVTKWCGNTAVRGQVEINVSVKVRNVGKRALDIGRSHFVLIVSSLNRAKWSAPRLGHSATEVPFPTTYRGRKLWAIPANYDRAYDPFPNEGGVGTFATHWGGSTLAPGDTFWPKHRDRGVLSFYKPKSRHQTSWRQGVRGVAYVSGRRIVVLCNDWGPQIPEREW